MSIELAIVTPQGESYRGTVEGVVLPGTEGIFGVLPSHERFLTPLRVGEVAIQTGSETLYAAVADGFADVTGSEVSVLVESCELAGRIDKQRAEEARARIEARLGELGEDDGEREELAAALERAVNRLAVGARS
jgi:F-type H+-transporting ATPase subunit epsilon